MEQKRFRRFCLYQIKLIEEQLRSKINLQLNKTLYVNRQNQILENKDIAMINPNPNKKTDIVINLAENDLLNLFIKKEKQKEMYMNIQTTMYDNLKTKSYNTQDTFRKVNFTQAPTYDGGSIQRISGEAPFLFNFKKSPVCSKIFCLTLNCRTSTCRGFLSTCSRLINRSI